MNKKDTIVIFGGSGEIGYYLASSLRAKFNIISVHNSTKHTTKKNNGIYEIVSDMTNVKNVSKVCKQLFHKYSINIVINCIGLNNAYEIDDIDEEKWDAVIDTNLKSVFFITKEIKNNANLKNVLIINFTSTAGIRPQLASPHYIAAKAGVNALTKYFARKFAPGIRVNAIAPGYVLTERHNPEKYNNYQNIIKQIPLERMANLEEILNSVEFLINNKYITGQIIIIDGGITL